MSWPGYDRRGLAAIAVGGVLGATLRWLITRSDESAATAGGWFTYAPTTSVTVGSNMQGFEPARSTDTIYLSGGIPLDTLIVNLLGCLILGALTALLVRSLASPQRVLIGAATGFCGSLTTFSTFAVELAILLRGTPVLPSEFDGLYVAATAHISTALVYVTLSLAGGALAFWLGRRLAQRIVASPGGATIGGAA